MATSKVPKLQLEKLQVGRGECFTDRRKYECEPSKPSTTPFESLGSGNYYYATARTHSPWDRTSRTERGTEEPRRPGRKQKVYPGGTGRVHRGRKTYAATETKLASTRRPLPEPSQELQQILQHACGEQAANDENLMAMHYQPSTENKINEYSHVGEADNTVYWKRRNTSSPRMRRSLEIRRNRGKNMPRLISPRPNTPTTLPDFKISETQPQRAAHQWKDKSQVIRRRVYHYYTSIYDRFNLLAQDSEDKEGALDQVAPKDKAFEKDQDDDGFDQFSSDNGLPPPIKYCGGLEPSSAADHLVRPSGYGRKRPHSSPNRFSKDGYKERFYRPKSAWTRVPGKEQYTSPENRRPRSSPNRFLKSEDKAKPKERHARPKSVHILREKKQYASGQSDTIRLDQHGSKRGNQKRGTKDETSARSCNQPGSANADGQHSSTSARQVGRYPLTEGKPISYSNFKHVKIEPEYFPCHFSEAWKKDYDQKPLSQYQTHLESTTDSIQIQTSPRQLNEESISLDEPSTLLQKKIKENQRVEDDPEFQRWIAAHGRRDFVKKLQQTIRLLRQWFRWIDVDDSGTVDIQELTDTLLSLGLATTYQEVRALLHAVKGTLPPEVAAVFAHVRKQSFKSEDVDDELTQLLTRIAPMVDEKEASDETTDQDVGLMLGLESHSTDKNVRTPTVDGLRLKMQADLRIKESGQDQKRSNNADVPMKPKDCPELEFHEFVTLLTNQEIIETAKTIVEIENQVKYVSKDWQMLQQSSSAQKQRRKSMETKPRRANITLEPGANQKPSSPRRASVGAMEIDPASRRLYLDLEPHVGSKAAPGGRKTLHLRPRRASYEDIMTAGATPTVNGKDVKDNTSILVEDLSALQKMSGRLDDVKRSHRGGFQSGVDYWSTKPQTSEGMKNPLTRFFKDFFSGRIGQNGLSFPIIISSYRRKKLLRACCGETRTEITDDFLPDFDMHNADERLAHKYALKLAHAKFHIPEGVTMGLNVAKTNLREYERRHRMEES